IGLLSPASPATITVKGSVDQGFGGAQIVNTASASSTTADPSPANNSAQATLTVTRSADVSIVKTGPSAIPANHDATYTLTPARRRGTARRPAPRCRRGCGSSAARPVARLPAPR